MREWALLTLTFAPIVALGFIYRMGGDPPTWLRVIGLGWFVVGALILGWYDGWLKRALVGVLIFIPLMAIFVWWSGAVPSGWPTAIAILLIFAPTAVLVVLGLSTGWFGEVRDDLRRAFGKEPRHAKDA